MRKRFGVAMLSGMMLLGSFSNVMAAQPTELPNTVVSEAGIMPRAVTLNYGNEVIPYDGTLMIARNTAFILGKPSKSELPVIFFSFKIHKGVPVTLGFNLTDQDYVHIYFKDGQDITEIFTGEVKDFQKTITFDKDVNGTFFVENWSAGSITINNIFVRY